MMVKFQKNNPGLVNKNNWLPEIYQIGLRNPQGLELSLLLIMKYM